MCHCLCDSRYLICCMFSFICKVSWSIYDISILLCSILGTIYVVSKNRFPCFNKSIEQAKKALSVSIVLHPVCYVVFSKSCIRTKKYMRHSQNYNVINGRFTYWPSVIVTSELLLEMNLDCHPTFIMYPVN